VSDPIRAGRGWNACLRCDRLQRVLLRATAFTDPRLCAAIVDRLTFGGTIIETGTDSYRLAHTTWQRAERP
jgi:hypothetical protein